MNPAKGWQIFNFDPFFYKQSQQEIADLTEALIIFIINFHHATKNT